MILNKDAYIGRMMQKCVNIMVDEASIHIFYSVKRIKDSIGNAAELTEDERERLILYTVTHDMALRFVTKEVVNKLECVSLYLSNDLFDRMVIRVILEAYLPNLSIDSRAFYDAWDNLIKKYNLQGQ